MGPRWSSADVLKMSYRKIVMPFLESVKFSKNWIRHKITGFKKFSRWWNYIVTISNVFIICANYSVDHERNRNFTYNISLQLQQFNNTRVNRTKFMAILNRRHRELNGFAINIASGGDYDVKSGCSALRCSSTADDVVMLVHKLHTHTQYHAGCRWKAIFGEKV